MGFLVLVRSQKLISRKLTVTEYSVEISWFFINQILREVNFGDSRSAKSAISIHLEALNLMFYKFGKFKTLKSAKIHKHKNSKPQNVLKWKILHI